MGVATTISGDVEERHCYLYTGKTVATSLKGRLRWLKVSGIGPSMRISMLLLQLSKERSNNIVQGSPDFQHQVARLRMPRCSTWPLFKV